MYFARTGEGAGVAEIGVVPRFRMLATRMNSPQRPHEVRLRGLSAVAAGQGREGGARRREGRGGAPGVGCEVARPVWGAPRWVWRERMNSRLRLHTVRLRGHERRRPHRRW